MRVDSSTKYFSLAQRRPSPVPFIQHGTRHRPPDSYVGVVPEQHPLVLRRIVVGGLVLHVRDLGNHDKAVREPRWNPRHLLGEAFQVEAHPFAEGAGAFAQIHRDIPDLAESDANQLSLRPTDLVVKAAQDVLGGARMVVLHELDVEPGGVLERLAVVAFQEEAARVLEHLRLEDQDLRNFRADDLHQKSRSESTLSRYSP